METNRFSAHSTNTDEPIHPEYTLMDSSPLFLCRVCGAASSASLILLPALWWPGAAC